MLVVEPLDGLGVDVVQRADLGEGLAGAALEYPFGLAVSETLARIGKVQLLAEVALAVGAEVLAHPHLQSDLAARHVQVAHLAAGVLVNLGRGPKAVRAELMRGGRVAVKRDAFGRVFDAVKG